MCVCVCVCMCMHDYMCCRRILFSWKVRTEELQVEAGGGGDIQSRSCVF